ncbi:hypothetical protein BDQ17DRAFT_1321802 [Cyathus striatus]|nr:hypothetical protein BDQ17DRAFT_1321802 [Cyathus striatus]
MSPVAKRQVIATLRNGLWLRRTVHSSSPSRAAMVVSTDLLAEEPEEIVLAPIFDIFDAPSRLGEAGSFIREVHSKSSSSIKEQPSATSSMSMRSRSLPTTLPPPILFDGPARPRNLPFSLEHRRQLRPTPASSRRHHTPSLTSQDLLQLPPVQLFEGPARITRYHHKSTNSTANKTKHLLILGLTGAVGCATLAKDVILS